MVSQKLIWGTAELLASVMTFVKAIQVLHLVQDLIPLNKGQAMLPAKNLRKQPAEAAEVLVPAGTMGHAVVLMAVQAATLTTLLLMVPPAKNLRKQLAGLAEGFVPVGIMGHAAVRIVVRATLIMVLQVNLRKQPAGLAEVPVPAGTMGHAAVLIILPAVQLADLLRQHQQIHPAVVPTIHLGCAEALQALTLILAAVLAKQIPILLLRLVPQLRRLVMAVADLTNIGTAAPVSVIVHRQLLRHHLNHRLRHHLAVVVLNHRLRHHLVVVALKQHRHLLHLNQHRLLLRQQLPLNINRN